MLLDIWVRVELGYNFFFPHYANKKYYKELNDEQSLNSENLTHD